MTLTLDGCGTLPPGMSVDVGGILPGGCYS